MNTIIKQLHNKILLTEGADQMGIPHATVLQLQTEGTLTLLILMTQG